MFITFFLPTFVEHSQLSHQLYRQMEAMGCGQLHVIAPAYYFQERTCFPEWHHINQPWLQKQFYHPYPSQEQIEAFSKSVFPDDFLEPLRKHFRTETVIYNILQSDVIPGFVDWLSEQILLVHKQTPVEGILAWRDCASLSVAAQKLNIPVVYNELGPFRNPTHHETFFWDCQGVKNSEEPARRFESIRNDRVLRRKFELFCERYFPDLFQKPTSHGCAVLMACEEDFAFMRGFSNYRLLGFAKEQFPDKPILVRPHPLGRNVRYEGVEYDITPTVSAALQKCSHAVTLYSNAGIEMLARGTRVTFLGDTPLRFLSDDTMHDDEKAWKVGFFCLNYLVPGSFMFDPDYYRWRLTRPAEAAIAERHMNVWEKTESTKDGLALFDRRM